MALDLILSPIYRINGQEADNMPGLLASTPPHNATRGRDQDRLVTFLLLTGNSTFTTTEYMQVATDAVKTFYGTSGSITNALRAATESINNALLERNMESSSRGQYVVGWLALGVLREAQFTLSLSGPMHLYYFAQHQAHHIHEPHISGKGLGISQSSSLHYTQIVFQPNSQLLICGRVPAAWESTLNDVTPSSLSAMRRRLTTLTSEDLNAVLIQSKEGTGKINLVKENTEPEEEKSGESVSTPQPILTSPNPTPQDIIARLPRREKTAPQTEPSPAPPPASEPEPEHSSAHIVQPSAYAIPPTQQEEPFLQEQTTNTDPLASLPHPTEPDDFPASIPRAKSQAQSIPENDSADVSAEQVAVEEKKAEVPEPPHEPSENARRAARTLAGGIRTSRRLSQTFAESMGKFLPRLLPNSDNGETSAMPSNALMLFMAIAIPLIVVTIASVVFLRYGRSPQYDTYLQQAQILRDQAVSLTDPVEQRKAWENVLLNVAIAESHRKTPDTLALRQEAEKNLDTLLGITRLQFNPVFSSNLGIDISRMAASESDLFMLNAESGEVLRAQLTTGRGFQLDTAFNCKPGVYGNYTVGPLVDILALPVLNSIQATVLGIDANGNLLYCAPGQVAQAIPLPPPDTNWGRVTAFVMDGGNLYVLDSPSRAVWVYTGKDGTFVDHPYFFFGGQTPEKQDVIDLIVTGDDLYMLHADGHISTCSYSRVESIPTRCQDPTPLVNPFAAYQGVDLFGTAHFTQMLFSAPPDQSILILDADTQGVMRFTPRTLELENQFRPTTGADNPIPPGPVGAIAVSPNHVMYLAVSGQVYFAAIP